MTFSSKSNLAYDLSFKPSEDQLYLDGILKNDFKVLNKIYKKFSPSICKFVTSNNGSVDDAHDVFQDGLVVIYKKLRKNDLELTSGFHAYLFAICRFIWLRELKKKNRSNLKLDQFQHFISDIDIEKDLCRYEKQTFFREKLNALPEDSKKVLKMFFDKKSLKEIAEEMGYSTEYAKKKKYLAQQMLINAIKSDLRFKQHTS